MESGYIFLNYIKYILCQIRETILIKGGNNMEKIRERILNLRKEISRYNEAYYSQNTSLISDVEFDAKLKELEDLENKYPQFKDETSPTSNVGSSLKNTKFQKVKHDVPMLSLANSYNSDDIRDFVEKVILGTNCINPRFAVEVKLDGLSISIKYEKGRLVRAVTRGDGNIGEDVTENIMAIKSIPKTLNKPVTCEVRGEVVMPRSSFKMLNDIRKQNGEETFANPRNAASGTLRQLDSSIVAERDLDAYFYYLINAEDLGFKLHSDAIAYLDELGLKTTGICKIAKSVDEIIELLYYWSTARQGLDYDTDGMVIKANDFADWKTMGNTHKVPKWAIAYKFPAVQVTTKLRDITWQVGRTGKLTPVAELDTVELSGSRISRATLHNMDYIESKDIRIGDTVFIEKAAEIIPQVASVVKDARNGNEQKVHIPRTCPECGGVVKDYSNVDIRCTNPKCPAVVKGAIVHFVSRDCMNIKGLGDEIVSRFVDLGLLSDVADIYNLKNHRGQLIKLDHMGEKSIDNLLHSIERSKLMPYSKVLNALGIPNVGLYMALMIAKDITDIDSLMSASRERLCEINGIADTVADRIIDYFSDKNNRNLIDKLRGHGLCFSKSMSTKPTSIYTGEFTGKSVLFTGKLSTLTRREAIAFVAYMGGTNASGVSKSLDYLVVGEDAGSKLEKAKAIGTVKILTEEEFMQILRKMKQK